MVLDHINGIPNDNRIENLRFLCPNCNSQTDTFAGRNTNRNKKSKIKVPRKRKFEVSKEELKILLENNSFVSISKIFGVSDNAIRKRCKILGIEI
jgi:5-methylcytosine-specific restriction endonuclease McrA